MDQNFPPVQRATPAQEPSSVEQPIGEVTHMCELLEAKNKEIEQLKTDMEAVQKNIDGQAARALRLLDSLDVTNGMDSSSVKAILVLLEILVKRDDTLISILEERRSLKQENVTLKQENATNRDTVVVLKDSVNNLKHLVVRYEAQVDTLLNIVDRKMVRLEVESED